MFRLNSFKSFTENNYNLSIDMLIEQIVEGLMDPYDTLSQYAAYLKKANSISNLSINQRVSTVKNFLEYNDVEISPRKFKLKVKLPKAVRGIKKRYPKRTL
jgi:hypothetical protein